MDDKELTMKSFSEVLFLSSVIVTGPAIAHDDFHALGQASGPTPMSEKQLAAVEGGKITVKFEIPGLLEVFETKVGAFTDITKTIGGLLPPLYGK